MPRWFDIVIALSLLLLLLPLFFIIAFAILLSTRGQVFYSQQRLGKNGRPFRFYKFRTMEVDADTKIHLLLQTSPQIRMEWLAHQKLRRDPRVFPVGKFLRRFSLDELPQLYNVLKGDLSIVGPRPYMVNQQHLLGGLQRQILSVRPGITGLWQTSGRSNKSFKKRVGLDALYTRKRSAFLDIKLLCKTLPVVLFANDAC